MTRSRVAVGKEINFPPWVGYVLPTIVFGILTAVEGYAPRAYYVWLYLAKVCLVTAALVVCRGSWRDISPSAKVLPAAVLVGLAVFAQWIILDKWISYPRLGSRSGFNPFEEIVSPTLRMVFLSARLYGLVLMVPLMEEIFWRSFLLRYLTDPDFLKVAQGAFSWTAFLVVAIAFGVSHPEWPVAVITACAYALLLRRTRSLFGCVVAHVISNLSLAAYVLVTGEWSYW